MRRILRGRPCGGGPGAAWVVAALAVGCTCPVEGQTLQTGGMIFVQGPDGQVRELPIGTKISIQPRGVAVGGPAGSGEEAAERAPVEDPVMTLGRARRLGAAGDAAGALGSFRSALASMEAAADGASAGGGDPPAAGGSGSPAPTLADAYLTMATAFRAGGLPAEAEALLLEGQDRWLAGSLADHPSTVRLLAALARSQEEQGAPDEALQAYRQALEVSSRCASGASGRPGGGDTGAHRDRAAFETLLKAGLDRPEPRGEILDHVRFLAHRRAGEGHDREALDWVAAGLAAETRVPGGIAPARIALLEVAASIHRDAGRWSESIRHLSEALALQDRLARPLRGSAAAGGDSLGRRGATGARAGGGRARARSGTWGDKIPPSPPGETPGAGGLAGPATPGAGRLSCALAVVLHRAGRFPEAIGACQRAVRIARFHRDAVGLMASLELYERILDDAGQVAAARRVRQARTGGARSPAPPPSGEHLAPGGPGAR